MLAIITGTICPSGDMKQLAICNAEERLEQYKKSLRFFIGSGAFSKICRKYGTEHTAGKRIRRGRDHAVCHGA